MRPHDSGRQVQRRGLDEHLVTVSVQRAPDAATPTLLTGGGSGGGLTRIGGAGGGSGGDLTRIRGPDDSFVSAELGRFSSPQSREGALVDASRVGANGPDDSYVTAEVGRFETPSPAVGGGVHEGDQSWFGASGGRTPRSESSARAASQRGWGRMGKIDEGGGGGGARGHVMQSVGEMEGGEGDAAGEIQRRISELQSRLRSLDPITPVRDGGVAAAVRQESEGRKTARRYAEQEGLGVISPQGGRELEGEGEGERGGGSRRRVIYRMWGEIEEIVELGSRARGGAHAHLLEGVNFESGRRPSVGDTGGMSYGGRSTTMSPSAEGLDGSSAYTQDERGSSPGGGGAGGRYSGDARWSGTESCADSDTVGVPC